MLAHDIHGSGRPVVLLHSILTNREMWHPQLAAWSQRFKVVRIDLPGHGESGLATDSPSMASFANDVWAALDAIGLDEVSLVGLSLGGMVAQAMALQRPERLRALVLAHTSSRTDDHVRHLWDERLASFEQQGVEPTVGSTLGRWFTPPFAERAPLTTAWIAGMIRRTPFDGYAAAVRAIQRLDHWDRLPTLATPTLVVAGDSDKAIPVEASRALAARLPRSTFEVIAQAAHLGNVEQATPFTEIVGAFLDQAPDARAGAAA